MRIVFLDFDGVITTSGTYKRATKVMIPQAWGPPEPHWPNPLELISRPLLANVSDLALQIGAGIVLTTSWRENYKREKLEGWLREAGLHKDVQIIGETPEKPGIRGNEIHAWMEDHPSITKTDIVILEDKEDVFPYRGRQVKTSFVGSNAGFTQRHLVRALRLFP